MENLLDDLKKLLETDERLVDKGKLYKNKIMELALKLDKDLLKLLFSNDKMKKVFFTDIEGVFIFDKDKFIRFVSNKQFLPDSYTAFKNKIGLTVDDEFISEKKDVVLSWPYKDCVLKGGMTKEDQKRNEIFWNETLAPDEISRLLEPKVFTNAKKIDKDGEHNFDGFRTDINGDIKDNLIIRGDSFFILHYLKKQFENKVKLIYIDPPYYFGETKQKNTLLYNSNFNILSWLTFMKDRLILAHSILNKQGVIFIQINDDGLCNLKVILDEIFGIENFINIISIKTGDSLRAIGGGKSKRLRKKAEFILLYAKNRKFFQPNPIYELTPLNEIIDSKRLNGKEFEYNSILVSEGKRLPFDSFIDGQGNSITIFKHEDYIIQKLKNFTKFNNINNDNELYNKYSDKIFRLAISESSILKRVQEKIDKNFYSIEYVPRFGKNKGISTKRYFYKQNEIIFLSSIIKKENNIIYRKEILSNLWTDISWQGIMGEGGVSLKYGKKPEKLIKRIIEYASNNKDLVLDYFAGSGTTCAVAHKMGRQYISIEQIDYGENSEVNRLKNVIQGDKTGISKEVNWKGGGEFIYLELIKQNENLSNNYKFRV